MKFQLLQLIRFAIFSSAHFPSLSSKSQPHTISYSVSISNEKINRFSSQSEIINQQIEAHPSENGVSFRVMIAGCELMNSIEKQKSKQES